MLFCFSELAGECMPKQASCSLRGRGTGPPRGGAGGGATCPGPQTSRGLQLEKYPKIEQGPIKLGASTRH